VQLSRLANFTNIDRSRGSFPSIHDSIQNTINSDLRKFSNYYKGFGKVNEAFKLPKSLKKLDGELGLKTLLSQHDLITLDSKNNGAFYLTIADKKESDILTNKGIQSGIS